MEAISSANVEESWILILPRAKIVLIPTTQLCRTTPARVLIFVKLPTVQKMRALLPIVSIEKSFTITFLYSFLLKMLVSYSLVSSSGAFAAHLSKGGRTKKGEGEGVEKLTFLPSGNSPPSPALGLIPRKKGGIRENKASPCCYKKLFYRVFLEKTGG